ncbi:MAG: SMC-Scp complex subunit ScpB [Thermoguttaceae bacterium]
MWKIESSVGWKLHSAAMRYRPFGKPFGRTYGRIDNLRPSLWNVVLEAEHPPDGGANARNQSLIEVEAILFLAAHPVSSRKLAELAGLADGTKARTLVRTLNRMYDAQGCAFRVEETAGGFRLMTRTMFAPWLRRLHSSGVEVRLSAPAMETLAVVAYRQPILRAEIEAIRGVQSGEVLRQLVEQDLVRITGRSPELGRPFLYGTSKHFLQIFGLKHIEELPRPESFQHQRGQTDQGESRSNSPESISQQLNYSLEEDEEANVKNTNTTPALLEKSSAEIPACLAATNPDDQIDSRLHAQTHDDDDVDDDDDDELDDEYDEDDDSFDEDQDLDDEPWEEVDDEEEGDLDDDDWDDEDWDDDDEDWDEDDDDWDDDEDDDDEEED